MKKLPTQNDLSQEAEAVKIKLKRDFSLGQFIGKSHFIEDLQKKILTISSCDVSSLITGESGTGKELAARAIHYLSHRSGNPFIPVNCGAISETLFENELFGHCKGAFTDASFHNTGLIQEAEGGSLFLDEIGSVGPHVQVKLLRFLQDKEFKPLGGAKHQKADIRIITATNQDLPALIKKGLFREDLFYRLNIVSLHLKPLRERKEDIPILVEHFVKKYSKKYHKLAKEVLSQVMKVFISYPWPGNIRELENKIQQIVVMSTSSIIGEKDIQFPKGDLTSKKLQREYFNIAKTKVINSFEKTYLTTLLTEYKGDVVSAAKKAGKSRTGLWNLLKKHKLSPKQFHS